MKDVPKLTRLRRFKDWKYDKLWRLRRWRLKKIDRLKRWWSGDYGVRVTLWRELTHGKIDKEIFRNVTEVHFNHGRAAGMSSFRTAAFESDIHGTGVNCWTVLEFETRTETEIAEAFFGEEEETCDSTASTTATSKASPAEFKPPMPSLS